jgi:hypothetical protein
VADQPIVACNLNQAGDPRATAFMIQGCAVTSLNLDEFDDCGPVFLKKIFHGTLPNSETTDCLG